MIAKHSSEASVPGMLEERKMENETLNRDRIIVRTSIIGILTNVLLAGFKAAVGLLSNSIAVILDAVNNLSDALSSVITIVGTKLAGRLPDKKHPLGYGRIEYLSALIVSAIVLYAGITSFIESVKKIIHPEKAEYTVVSLVIIAVAVVVKLILGSFVKAQGKAANSGALVASGSDAMFDAILSASVLASAVIFMLTGISLEAYVGVAISVVIIKAGIEMMTETLDDILGQRADAETTIAIKRILNAEPEVRGAYDLVLNNYGPDKNIGSVHLELPDTMTVEQVDELTRRVQAKVLNETGVILTGVGVYSYNTKNDEAAKIRNTIQKLVLSHDWALQFHGFYVDIKKKSLRFDVVMSFEIDPKDGLDTLYKEVREAYPDYDIYIAPDVDVSD
jgi:cation diffusion facilitator family transporter